MPVAAEINTQSVSAAKWSTIGTVTKFALQFIAQIILARLVGPEGFGLFAMGLIVMTFSDLIANFGFAWGLIQSQDLTKEDIRFTFTWQLVSGFVMALALYVLAPSVAAYFNEPQLRSIVRWLSPACLLNAAAAPAIHLLLRDLDFRAVHVIQVLSSLIGYFAVGVPLACMGGGVWALVAAWLTQTLTVFLLSVVHRPYPMKPLIWHSGAARLSSIGLTVFVTNICNWALRNLDRVFLGRFVDAYAVGVYVRGHSLATTPNMLLGNNLKPLFFAAGARIQSQPERLRRAYLSVIATVWVIVAPIFVILAIVGQDLVDVLYGKAWSATGIVLSILALAMPAFITFSMSTPILWNTGRKHYESLLQLPILAIAAIAFYYFAREGAVTVAFVSAGVFLTRALVVTTAACRRLGIGCRDLLPYAVRAVAMMSLTAASTFAGANLGQVPGAMRFGALAGGLVFGSGLPILISVAFPVLLGQIVVEMLGRFSPSLSRMLRRRSVRG